MVFREIGAKDAVNYGRDAALDTSIRADEQNFHLGLADPLSQVLFALDELGIALHHDLDKFVEGSGSWVPTEILDRF